MKAFVTGAALLAASRPSFHALTVFGLSFRRPIALHAILSPLAKLWILPSRSHGLTGRFVPSKISREPTPKRTLINFLDDTFSNFLLDHKPRQHGLQNRIAANRPFGFVHVNGLPSLMRGSGVLERACMNRAEPYNFSGSFAESECSRVQPYRDAASLLSCVVVSNRPVSINRSGVPSSLTVIQGIAPPTSIIYESEGL